MSSLSVVDYILFALMLCVSGAIGIYHAIRSKNQGSKDYFLIENQNISSIPIAISLLVSFLSAISILGIPSEVYTYGLSYILVAIAFIFVILISAFLYVPVFYKMKIISTNEYLERRFTYGIRLMGSILFIMTYTMYLSIALFAPAIAMDAVSDLPIIVSVVVTGLICIFYTSLGGFRAVVWADVFQGVIIVGGMITILIMGILEVDGLSNVWRINKEMKRLNIFDFNPDPTVRSSFWAMIVGGTFTYIFSWSVSQLSVQRFLASKSLRNAKKAMLFSMIALVLFTILCCLNGLVIFAVYHDCDLSRSKKITRNDQILPYFVVDKLGHLKGLPGLFIAALFSGALSTLSSGINSVSAIVLEDIVKKFLNNISDARATCVSRIVGIVYGLLIMLGAIGFNYAKVPLLIQLSATLFNISAGPLLGLFTLGMISKKANWKGAYIGTGLAFSLLGWIYIGSLSYSPIINKPPTSIEGCETFNETRMINKTIASFKNDTVPQRGGLEKFYSLSFFYYGGVGMLVTVVIGYIFSIILGRSEDEQVDEELLFDFSGPCHSKRSKRPNNNNIFTKTTTL
ncbi:sodium-coupled monocarboxylate transporter 1-like [Xenia sp. Carnegie-2017]|uniref:sodium-coupled monocarboxylate transporter 1-like n=1 Tax=Xenia sp. Carnegie-2017 TaxID=2897299 RepID=UPI001F04AED0|nr:sodium-coupled monocarboxylate transporter 1-like [Xenia sp. Carnegie-2017]XP_046861299.1 sodium-coupled monocarboxylate transporter 1-like [Xenia sp. Carnegie-2017]